MSGSDVPIYGVHILWPDGDEKIFTFSGPAAFADACRLYGVLESRAWPGVQVTVNRVIDGKWVPATSIE
jgi:hypothetical protein